MIARAFLSFHPARLHAPSCFSSKPLVSPTCKISFCNSFVSPTYAITGECTPPKMSARRHFLSLCSLSPLSALLLFNGLRTLLFSVAHLSPVAPALSALFPQNRGCIPSGLTNCSRVDRTRKNRPPRKAAATGERFNQPPVTSYFPYLIYFLYLQLTAYQLCLAPHQLQPATYPLLPTEVTPQ